MKKENQRIMLTKRLLKESFVELLLQKDIHKISIRELCDNAGINHCTFYKYFGSQYDLLQEMENDMLYTLGKTLSELTENAPLKIMLSYLQDNVKIARLLINNNVDPLFPRKLFSLPVVQEFFLKRLSDNYSKNNFDYMCSFIFYGAFRVAQKWLNKDERESPEEIEKLLISLLNKFLDI